MDGAARRLRQAFELIALAEDMLRARLRREHPKWTRRQVEARVVEWRLQRPGAEHGDTVGTVRELPPPAARRSSKR
jgi:hypothetical protein